MLFPLDNKTLLYNITKNIFCAKILGNIEKKNPVTFMFWYNFVIIDYFFVICIYNLLFFL